MSWKHTAEILTLARQALLIAAGFWRLLSVSRAAPEPKPILNDSVCKKVIVKGLAITKCKAALGMTQVCCQRRYFRVITGLVLLKRTQGGLSITDCCIHCVLEACRERVVRPVLPLEQINAVFVVCLLTYRTNKARKKGLLDEEIGEEG